MGTKQNDKSGIDTVLKDFPLFCPKCKLTHIIDVEKLEIVIKNTDLLTKKCRKLLARMKQKPYMKNYISNYHAKKSINVGKKYLQKQ